MTLRGRLVVSLLVLFAAGMTVYGVASYRGFESSELARLDEQVRGTLPVAERELRLRVDGIDVGRPPGPRGTGPGTPGYPLVMVAPGTYAELRDVDGTPLEPAILFEDGPTQPDLSGIGTSTVGQMSTVPSIDGEADWRVAASSLPDGRSLLVAVPMTSLKEALARLLTIQLVAGGALLVAIGLGAWFVLRSGLRPLERMAETASSITAGNLEQRVDEPSADTEVKQLASALNTMLDELEGAFREREATEAKLRRFLSDASHELRTPLTSIQGYAELFRLGTDREEVDLELIMRRIEDESGRMRGLVENLLALARLDEALHEPVREPVDLTVLAADACSDAAVVAPDRPILLDTPAPAQVLGDIGYLRQAIGNLVANSLRHTPPGTSVEVAVHTADGHARVVVRDHGPGLDDAALLRAFDRFWQADPSRVGVSAGLGLSIVQAVAASHDGAVSVRNAEDGGAVFTITLPCAPQHPGERPSDGVTAARAHSDEGTRHGI